MWRSVVADTSGKSNKKPYNLNPKPPRPQYPKKTIWRNCTALMKPCPQRIKLQSVVCASRCETNMNHGTRDENPTSLCRLARDRRLRGCAKRDREVAPFADPPCAHMDSEGRFRKIPRSRILKSGRRGHGQPRRFIGGFRIS